MSLLKKSMSIKNIGKEIIEFYYYNRKDLDIQLHSFTDGSFDELHSKVTLHFESPSQKVLVYQTLEQPLSIKVPKQLWRVTLVHYVTNSSYTYVPGVFLLLNSRNEPLRNLFPNSGSPYNYNGAALPKSEAYSHICWGRSTTASIHGWFDSRKNHRIRQYNDMFSQPSAFFSSTSNNDFREYLYRNDPKAQWILAQTGKVIDSTNSPEFLVAIDGVDLDWDTAPKIKVDKDCIPAKQTRKEMTKILNGIKG